MKRIFIGLLVFCIACWTVAGFYYAGKEIIFFKNMNVTNALITLVLYCAGKNITDVYFYNATNHVSILYGFIIYAPIITGFIILGEILVSIFYIYIAFLVINALFRKLDKQWSHLFVRGFYFMIFEEYKFWVKEKLSRYNPIS
tara:strand:- start:187 stop:615 length:429 start_codon:yes stop_codon:yes gene_type:complete